MEYAVLYSRYSTADQVDQGIGPEIHERRMRAYCEMKGYDVHRFYLDRAVSGKTRLRERPFGMSMLREIQADGTIKHVVFFRLDRAFRSALDCWETIESLQAQGIEVHILDMNVDTTTAHGRLFLKILACMAEWEREMIQQKSVDTFLHKLAKGERYTSRKFGYKVVPQRGGKALFELDDREVEAVRTMFNLRRQDVTLQGICDTLHGLGVNPPTKKQWYPETIRRILRNPRWMTMFGPEAEISASQRRRMGQAEGGVA